MILAIAGQKGGTGKSTIAVAIAAELHRRGLNVLMIDADPQATMRTWGDVAADAGLSTPTIVAMGSNMAEPGQLPKLAESYDCTIIDCPGRDGRIQRAAMLVADVVLLPSGPSAADAWAMAASVEVLREAQMVNRNLRAFVALTRRDTRTVIGTAARKNLGSLGVPVLKTELGTRVCYQEFLASGQGLADYAPKDRAAKEVEALTDEVLELLAGSVADASTNQHETELKEVANA